MVTRGLTSIDLNDAFLPLALHVWMCENSVGMRDAATANSRSAAGNPWA